MRLWKQWPYWKKGGVIGLFALIPFIIFSILCIVCGAPLMPLVPFFMLPIFPDSWSISLAYLPFPFDWIIVWPIVFILYFSIGALLGCVFDFLLNKRPH